MCESEDKYFELLKDSAKSTQPNSFFFERFLWIVVDFRRDIRIRLVLKNNETLIHIFNYEYMKLKFLRVRSFCFGRNIDSFTRIRVQGDIK